MLAGEAHGLDRLDAEVLGRQRRFALLGWPVVDAATWRLLLDEADAGRVDECPTIMASDRDPVVIAIAKANAARATGSWITMPSIGSAGAVQGARSTMRRVSAYPACHLARMPAGVKSMSFV
jgi:hypothetical protein